MSYQHLNDRQILNSAALGNIGTPANETLDVIFAAINSALSGLTGSTGYIAKEVALTSGSGTTSYTVIIPTQVDTSYVVYAILENLVDANPQIQQVMVCNKSETGFTAEWNTPLSSSNYVLSYIIPYKTFTEVEYLISSNVIGSVNTLPISQNGANYGIIAAMENYGDVHPQFQPITITAQGSTSFETNWNVPTLTGNNVISCMINATSLTRIISTTQSLLLPVNYNTTGYAVMALFWNVVDAYPQFQPLLVTAKTNDSFTVQCNVAPETGNYYVYYYVISLTP
jgi:hypothetical protein